MVTGTFPLFTAPGLPGDGDRNAVVVAKELQVLQQSPGQQGKLETWGPLPIPSAWVILCHRQLFGAQG